MSGWTSNAKPPHPPVKWEDVLAEIEKLPSEAEIPWRLFMCDELWKAIRALVPEHKPLFRVWPSAGSLEIHIDEDVPRDAFDVQYMDGHRERRHLTPERGDSVEGA